MKNLKAKTNIIFAVIATFIVLSIAIRFIIISAANSSISSGKPGMIIIVTDKQIINDYTRNGSSGTTENEFVIFTNKGAYLCGSFIDEASIYGQLQKDSTYEVWTIPSMSFSYKGSIIKLKPVHNSKKIIN